MKSNFVTWSTFYRRSDDFASSEAQEDHKCWIITNHAGEHDHQVLHKLVDFLQLECCKKCSN